MGLIRQSYVSIKSFDQLLQQGGGVDSGQQSRFAANTPQPIVSPLSEIVLPSHHVNLLPCYLV
jgi:hypothetical protein